jgi:hypothetical protein
LAGSDRERFSCIIPNEVVGGALSFLVVVGFFVVFVDRELGIRTRADANFVGRVLKIGLVSI